MEKRGALPFVLIFLGVLFVAIFAVPLLCSSTANAEVKFGTKVVVIKGFYKDCTGIVTGEMEDGTVVPPVRQYWIELVCKDDEGKDRTVVDFLPASDVRELRFKHCDKNTCDNREGE